MNQKDLDSNRVKSSFSIESNSLPINKWILGNAPFYYVVSIDFLTNLQKL
ncbi:hypothetical protein LLB_2317 [Legionella longbeachae D-4968]|nr:hypothetical protein LLB_2317 [Legionella longbeachae D-4968]